MQKSRLKKLSLFCADVHSRSSTSVLNTFAMHFSRNGCRLWLAALCLLTQTNASICSYSIAHPWVSMTDQLTNTSKHYDNQLTAPLGSQNMCGFSHYASSLYLQFGTNVKDSSRTIRQTFNIYVVPNLVRSKASDPVIFSHDVSKHTVQECMHQRKCFIEALIAKIVDALDSSAEQLRMPQMPGSTLSTLRCVVLSYLDDPFAIWMALLVIAGPHFVYQHWRRMKLQRQG